MKIFISYVRINQEIAINLAEYLDSSGHTPWMDSKLRVGPEWQEQLKDNILSSEGFIGLVDQAWLNSEWCHWEYETASNFGKFIYLIQIEREIRLPISIQKYQILKMQNGKLAEIMPSLLGSIRTDENTVSSEAFDLPQRRKHLIEWLRQLEKADFDTLKFVLADQADIKAPQGYADHTFVVRYLEQERKLDVLENYLDENHSNRKPS